MEWLKEFKGRNEVLAVDVNMLWRDERLYVMDNHRCALWCWWQHFRSPCHLLHVDYHFDALWGQFNPWPNHTIQAHRTDLEAYLTAFVQGNGGPMELYRWDNFVAAFLSLEDERVVRRVFIGAEQGMEPIKAFESLGVDDLLEFLSGTVLQTPQAGPSWILDIDLDCFTIKGPDGKTTSRVNDAEVRACGKLAWAAHASGVAQTVTVALSPENTGGWAESERLLALFVESWPNKPCIE